MATASYQIEGAPEADGKGPSIWDTLTLVPGAIDDGSDGTVACASYPDPGPDIDLVTGLGVHWYRFSVSWPRIVPDGGVEVNKRGFDYYERLVDGLLERGVTPMATLYHWDLPQALEDRGGWLVRETPERFADYAMAVHDRLGDRVRLWATMNEPWCSAYLGYALRTTRAGQAGRTRRPPGGPPPPARARPGGRAHARGRGRRGRCRAQPDTRCCPRPKVLPQQPTASTHSATGCGWDRSWTGSTTQGPSASRPVLADPELVRPGDLDLVRGSADWLGVNYYTPARVAEVTDQEASTDPGGDADVDAFPGVAEFRFAPRHPRTDIDWEVDADSLERLLIDTHHRTGLPLLVTENGAAYADTTLLPDGSVDDTDRVEYLRSHLAAIDAARAAGADVRGWLVWTLMDNFEWSHGYTKTFGLVSVDRSTLRRTPKRSYHWFADLVRRRAT